MWYENLHENPGHALGETPRVACILVYTSVACQCDQDLWHKLGPRVFRNVARLVAVADWRLCQV